MLLKATASAVSGVTTVATGRPSSPVRPSAAAVLLSRRWRPASAQLRCDPGSRIASPGFSVSSAGSCPSSRSGYVSVSCDATGVLVGAAAVDAARCGGLRDHRWIACGVDRRFVGVRRPLHTHTAANHHAAQKNHDGDDGRGHEQKDQLLSIQLYLVKAFICH